MYNTGNTIPSAALEDMADNANVLDQMVNKTEGNVTDRTGLSRRVFQQIIMDMGFEPLSGSFQTGATLTQRNQVLQDETTGVFYSWSGVIPVVGKIIPPSSTPATSGGISSGAWVDRTNLTLRSELSVKDSDVVISEVRAGDMAAAYKNTPSNVISLSRMFGATNASDITSVLSSAIAYSKLNGFIPIVIDLKSALISGPLPVLNTGTNFVPISGLGKNRTWINLSSAGDGVFTMSGGSGGSGGVVLSGLTLIGGATQKPLKNTGFCGARVRDVYLDCGTAAVLSNDIATGTFTEFFLFDSCELNVNSIFEFNTGAGNDSFHGCGLTNRCIVNEKSTSTGLIKVGAAGDTLRTVWYNAPLDAQIFKRTAYPIIATQNSLSNIITTNGNLTVENFTASSQTFSAIGSASRHRHAGTINSWNGSILPGSAIFSNTFSTYPSGVVGNGVVSTEITYKTTTTTSVATGIRDDMGRGRVVSVSVSAGNYEYCFLVYFAGSVSPYITPTAVIISTVRSFNAAGFGLPTVSVTNDYELVVSNANWTGTVAVTSVGLPGSF